MASVATIPLSAPIHHHQIATEVFQRDKCFHTIDRVFRDFRKITDLDSQIDFEDDMTNVKASALG